jgi:hypothetical protein
MDVDRTGQRFDASQQLVRSRVVHNPKEVTEEKVTLGERIADSVARFGGSWTFIVYTAMNISLHSVEPIPFPLLTSCGSVPENVLLLLSGYDYKGVYGRYDCLAWSYYSR